MSRIEGWKIAAIEAALQTCVGKTRQFMSGHTKTTDN